MQHPAYKNIFVVYAKDEDQIGNGIWGIFTTHKKAKKALKMWGLKGKRDIGTMILNYRFTSLKNQTQLRRLLK